MSTKDQSVAASGQEVETNEVSGDGPTTAETNQEAEAADLSLDLIFEVLKNSRRREVLHYLREHDPDEQVSLGELAEHVAAIENDTTTEALTSSQRKRVYVGLYQCHLPKMDDMNVVDFNQDRGRVSLGPGAESLEKYLDTPADEPQIEWHRYYAAVSAIGVVVLAVSAFWSLPVWTVMSLLGMVVAIFGFCSGCHWLVESKAENDS